MSDLDSYRLVQLTLNSMLDLSSLNLGGDTALSSLPGWDSLVHIAFIVNLEKLSGVEFEVEDIASVITIADVCVALEKYL